MNYNYPQIFAEQFKMIDENRELHQPTRSNKIIMPFHNAIAKQIESETAFFVNSLTTGFMKEERVYGPYGSKRVDIAIHDEFMNLRGVILFKGIRSSYNKNANNFIENMRGESSLLIDAHIPVYQIIFIPTIIRTPDPLKKDIPTLKSMENYNSFIRYANAHPFWQNLKVGVYYVDVDYNNYTGQYANKKIDLVENSLNEGISNFVGVI